MTEHDSGYDQPGDEDRTVYRQRPPSPWPQGPQDSPPTEQAYQPPPEQPDYGDQTQAYQRPTGPPPTGPPPTGPPPTGPPPTGPGQTAQGQYPPPPPPPPSDRAWPAAPGQAASAPPVASPPAPAAAPAPSRGAPSGGPAGGGAAGGGIPRARHGAGAPDEATAFPGRAAPGYDLPGTAGAGAAGPGGAGPGAAGPGGAAPGGAWAGQAGQAAPQAGWGSAAPPPPPPAAQADARGFVASLFDFSFTSFVTPKVVKVLYALIMIGVSLGAVILVAIAFRANAFFGLFTLFILAPLYFLVVMAIYRIGLEFFIVMFRISEDIRALRHRGDIR